MAKHLEQWEIDFRQQLQDASYDVPKGKTWEDKLREEISNIQPAPPRPHHPPKQNNTWMFAVVIILLLGAVVFAYNMKTGAISNWYNSHFRSAPACTEPPCDNPFEGPSGPTPPHNPHNELAMQVHQLRIDLDKMKAENATKYEEMQKKLKWNGDRITLLGMLNNENWLVIRNEGPNSSNYIYFNADWTLSRQPQYLQLTQADRDFLERFRKK